MDVFVNKEQLEFHLCNERVSYLFRVVENGQLEHLYFGKRIHHRKCGFQHLTSRKKRPYSAVGKEGVSLEHVCQEYPSFGTSDFRMPAMTIGSAGGSEICDFTYKEYKVKRGKRKLEGLPATYVESEEEATTLEILLYDEVLESRLLLEYVIYEEHNVICRNARIVHEGEEPITLKNFMSASVDFHDCDYEMIHLDGAWARERYVKKRKLQSGIQSIYSKRGSSSAVHNPFLALKRPDATEHGGEVYGFSLVYSGNFLAQVEVDTFQVTRIMMGLHPDTFQWTLYQGESFQTPECIFVYSDKGLNGMSQTFHDLYGNRLIRGYWRDRPRPILINSWEATYMNFTEEIILEIVKESKQLGIELFVLDDGWFGKRNNDKSSLGDWFVNEEKLPSGINGLSKKIESLGMKFGLWFEPEMVSKDSHIFQEYPDWIVYTPNRPLSLGRNQYVLDFSREEVVNYLFELIDKILRTSAISYLKWDMNRNITEAFSHKLPADKQGEFYHRYIMGVYQLHEKLLEKYPHLLIESCAGGGNRFDPGMLYYAPQGWISDNTDAIERLKIQYGTSFVYPLYAMGSHVSAVPNHQVGRVTSLEMRASVASYGTFGYELDVRKLTSQEKEKIRKQIAAQKKIQYLIRYGDFYRLISPFENGNQAAWSIVSKDKKEVIVAMFQILATPNPGYFHLKLKGLAVDRQYFVEETGTFHFGDELMYIGLGIQNNKKQDFCSWTFQLIQVR